MPDSARATRYFYWSSRRTDGFIEDEHVPVRSVGRTVTSPSFGWLPTFSRTVTDLQTTRARAAKAIEKSLGRAVISNFDEPGDIHYAKGKGTVVFGEFRTWMAKPPREQAVMFTTADYDAHSPESVAICLFGSMENFVDYIKSAEPVHTRGWASSSDLAVYNLIISQGKQLDDPYFRPEDMAIEALKIAKDQGRRDDGFATDKPWQRAFTYGDVREAEWLAQIYLDVDLLSTEYGSVDGFRRILVGAPYWIRTPDPRRIRIYRTTDDPEVTTDRQGRGERNSAKYMTVKNEPPTPNAPVNRAAAVHPPEIENGRERPPEPTIEVPANVYKMLRAGFLVNMASWAARQVDNNSNPRLLHLGDPFGTVFAWVWTRDKDQAMVLLADYLADLHQRGNEMTPEISPAIRLEEVLGALRIALPWWFSDYEEVVAMARRDVRDYFGADPNS